MISVININYETMKMLEKKFNNHEKLAMQENTAKHLKMEAPKRKQSFTSKSLKINIR